MTDILKSMRDILRRNLGYKLISLSLAIIFWLWITSQTEPIGKIGVYNINVPLVTYNQPSNIVIVSNIPPISVRLDNSNQGFSVEDLFAYIDLKDAVAGEHSYKVNLKTPEGVKIENISPSNVVLRLDTVKDKIVPLIVDIVGVPAEGFVAGDPIITPPVVNVRGPTSILENLENAYVEVNVSGKTESMKVAMPVSFKDPGGRGIFAPDPNLESLNSFPDTVEVVIPIYPAGTASKTVPLRVETTGTPAEGSAVRMVTPIPSQVLLMGTEKVLQPIQYVSLGRVEIGGLSSNKVVEIPLNSISLPEGVTFGEGTKLSVMVYIGPSSVSRTINNIPVGIRNIQEGLTAENIPAISLTVSGYPDTLDALKPGDISVWIDAAGLQAGTYPDTPALWKVPSGVTMVNVPKVQLILNSTVSPGTAGEQNGKESSNTTGNPLPT